MPNAAEQLVDPINDEELLGAINEELALPEPEPEPEPAPEPEPEPQPAAEPVAEPAPEGEPAADPVAEPAPTPEPAAEAKPSDEFGSLEDSVPEKTRERFNGLKTKYDEVVAERDMVKAEADGWVKAITGTGTNPQQFGMALTWLSKINSKKPEDLEDAYNIMSRELEAIGKAIGKPVPGRHDPLAEHADLKQKVEEGLMDEASAMEVAQARALRKLAQAQQQTEQHQTEQQKAVATGLESVKALGARLSANDPQFKAKVEFLTPIIQAAVASGAPPDKWAGMIETAWLKLPAIPLAPVAPARPAAPNPLRPTGASPSNTPMQAEPGSELEAINQALERGY